MHLSVRKSNHVLSLLGPRPHLRTFQNVSRNNVITSKWLLVDPITKSVMWSTKILSVEVGSMTTIIPPTAFIRHCTRTNRQIVVLIFGGKPHSTVKWRKEPLNVKKEGLPARGWNYYLPPMWPVAFKLCLYAFSSYPVFYIAVCFLAIIF